MQTILVAGASGHLGRCVVEQLLRQGARVRALTRRADRLPAQPGLEVVVGDLGDPHSLAGVCTGVTHVVSCAGASMDLRSPERASFTAIDFHGNRRLLEQARGAGVARFVYVSVFAPPALAGTEYVRAHEQFARYLLASDVPATVVRPTGFFYFLTELLETARRGRGFVVGAGTARSNPVHEADVAEACVAALAGGPDEIELGGPEVFTRREMTELAFEVVRRPPRIHSVPAGLVRGAAMLVRPLQPRLGALLRFGTEVGLVDAVAPARGSRTLRAYFEERVAAQAPAGT